MGMKVEMISEDNLTSDMVSKGMYLKVEMGKLCDVIR